MSGGEGGTPLPLYGACRSCFAPNGVRYVFPGSSDDILCPTCAQRQALWTAADQQLEEQVKEVAVAWLKVWGDVPGLHKDLSEILANIGERLEEELQAARSTREEVQPFPVNTAI